MKFNTIKRASKNVKSIIAADVTAYLLNNHDSVEITGMSVYLGSYGVSFKATDAGETREFYGEVYHLVCDCGADVYVPVFDCGLGGQVVCDCGLETQEEWYNS